MKAFLTLVSAACAAFLGWSAVTKKAPQIETDIRQRTTEALNPVSPGVEAIIDGRNVLLRGPQANAEAKTRTLETARQVWGALGPADGLWVPDASSTNELVSVEKKSDGDVTVAGVIGADSLGGLTSAVTQKLSPSFHNEVVTGQGNSRLSNVTEAIGALGLLDAGTLLMRPDRTVLTGQTTQQSVADSVISLAATQSPQWQTQILGPQTAEQASAATTPAASLLITKGPNNTLVANGDVEDDGQKQLLLTALKATASGPVIDNLSVKNAPMPDDWGARFTTGISALKNLNAGTLVLSGSQSLISGNGDTSTIRTVRDHLPSGWLSNLLPSGNGQNNQKSARRPGSCPSVDARLKQGTTILFDTGSSTVASQDRNLLGLFAASLTPCAGTGTVTVTGHTDSTGSDKLNGWLSRQRALAVREILTDRGLSAANIRVEAKGKTQPAVSNATTDTRAHNRRVTLQWNDR